jgi:hypothetical protein
MTFAMPRRWRDFPNGPYAPEPEVFRSGAQVWINADDLRRLMTYRAKHTVDNGYTNALLWVRLLLTEMLEDDNA